MITAKHIIYLAAPAVLAVVLLGCATARVDVDVYKGPLANHEDVQTEQMAVMAIGAKPLLIELRDMLQWPTNTQWERERATANCWYKAGYVEPEEWGDNKWVSRFSDERADRVNEILGLYEDLPDDEQKAALVSKAQEYKQAVESDASAEEKTKLLESMKSIAGELKEIESDVSTPRRADGTKIDAFLNAVDRAEALEDTGAEVPSQNVPDVQVQRMEKQPEGQGAEIDGLAEEVDGVTKAEKIEGAENVVKKAKAVATTYFTHGRLPQGLGTLIDEYLLKKDESPTEKNTIPVVGARQRLTDALVGFAEKLLYVANNDGILKRTHNASGQTAKDDLDRFVLVLQAVGNSILVQADELTCRKTHQEEVKRRVDAETFAIRRAYSDSPDRVLDDLVSHIAWRSDVANLKDETYVGLIDNEAKEKAKLETELAAEKDEAKQAEIKEKISKIQTKMNGLEQDRRLANKTRNALEVVKSLRSEALRDGIPASQVVKRLVGLIQSESKKAGVKQDMKEKYADALEMIATFPTPLEPPTDPMTNAKSSKDVLDDVIATLREEHIKVSRESGADSPRAEQLEATVELAYRYRSDFVYIRPPSAYLRTSYASTSLQDDPGLLWENMLGRHALRNMPLFGECFENGDKLKKAKIVADIDKQFWQNINSVRVSGAGRTNYVIAKDDIGNWYVKNYAADPQDIIKGAQSLALFSLGAEMNVDLLNRLPHEGGDWAPPVDLDTGRTVLDRLFKRDLDAYQAKTQGDLKSLGKLLIGTEPVTGEYSCPLTELVKAGWTANGMGTEYDTSLGKAASTWLKEAADKVKEAQVDEANAKSTLKTMMDTIKSADAASKGNVLPALELMLGELKDPARNKKIIDWLEANTPAEVKAKLLPDTFTRLRKQIGAENPGEVVIEALRAILSFHNTLVASVNPSGSSGSSAALEEAKAAEEKAEETVKEKTEAVKAANAALESAIDTEREAKTQAVKEAKTVLADAQLALQKASEEVRKQEETAMTAATKAAQVVSEIVGGTLKGYIQKRKETVKGFEDGVMMISDVASQ